MIEVAWTTPRSWIVGEVITDSLLNQYLRDNMLYLGDSTTRPMFRFTRSAGTALSAGAWTSMATDVDIYNIGSCRFSSTALTIPRAGWWMFDAWARLTMSTIGLASIGIRSGGSHYTASHFWPNWRLDVFLATRSTFYCVAGSSAGINAALYSATSATIQATSGFAGHWIRD